MTIKRWAALLCFAATVMAAPEATLTSDTTPSTEIVSMPRQSTTGFYPIWESTGYVERANDVRLGTTGAHYGIEDVAHIGVMPIGFMYRVPNVYAKFALWQSDNWKWALQGNFFYLLPGAGKSTLSPMYPSRLDNTEFGVALIPVSLSATYDGKSWLALHHTVTLMPLLTSGALKDEVFPAYTATAEFGHQSRHGALLHLGEIGFWKHDFMLVGASYRYRNSWLEFRLGYFYRMRSAGAQSGPLLGIGILL